MISIRRLIWDAGNVAHMARHGVVPDEVEEVCHGPYVTRQAYKGRVMLIGPTRAERVLAVVLGPAGEGVYYPVTARPASRRERLLYQEQRGGGTP